MKRMVVAATAALMVASVAMTTKATAADIGFVPPPPPPPVLTWAGFYVGGHVGWGEAGFAGRFHPGPDHAPDKENLHFSTLDPSGILFGVHGGYNWQMGRFVLGVEGDVSFLDWDDKRTNARGDWIDAEVDLLASVRGRAGFAFNRLLVYGTGGLAFSDASARAYDWDSDTRGRVKLDDIGWVVGGGAEFKITDNFSLRGETLYYMFDDKSRLRGIGSHTHQGPGGSDYAEFRDAWVIRGGANFHF